MLSAPSLPLSPADPVVHRAPSRPVSRRLDALQALRAMAAALVVIEHAFFTLTEKAGAASMGQLEGLSALGVKLFFAISGFIIVYTAAALPSGAGSLRTFLKRRLIRIVPIYWIVTTIYLVKLWLTGVRPAWSEILMSYGFVPYAGSDGLVRPILGVGWSLDYEMFFYLSFGLLLLLPRRWHVLATSAVMLGLVALRASGALTPSGGAATVAYHWADPVVLYFVAGMAIAWLHPRWDRPAAPPWSDGAVTVFCGVALLAFAWLLLPRQTAWVHDLAMPALCVLLVGVTVLAGGGAPGRWRQVLVAAGDASYSTYLTHGFVMGPLARLVARLELSIHPMAFAALSVLLCTLVGWVVYRLIEKPLLAAMR